MIDSSTANRYVVHLLLVCIYLSVEVLQIALLCFYLPPDDKAARAMGKKQKHMLQYVGPGEITEVLSPNNTSFRIRYQNRYYQRNVMHLSKYTSMNQVPGDLQVALDNEITVGCFIAVLDD